MVSFSESASREEGLISRSIGIGTFSQKQKRHINIFIFIVLTSVFLLRTMTLAILSDKPSGKLRSSFVADLQIYDMIPEQQGGIKPTFLEEFNPALLVDKGVVTIDYAHRHGILHIGVTCMVMDAEGLILLLRRGPHLVTCPNAWGIVGEHAVGRESVATNVKRGVVEELGEEVWKHVEKVQNLTTFPVYMKREIEDYGKNSRKGKRIDHQLLYMWAVTLDKRHEGVRLHLDDEVAEHKWISADDYHKWVKRDLKNDQPKDFCHPVVARLRSFEIDRLMEVRASNQAT